MNNFKHTSLLISALVIFPVSFANAQTTDTERVETNQVSTSEPTSLEWETVDFTLAFSGNAVKKDLLYKPITGDAVYTNQPNSKGNVAFSCFRGTLAANVGLIPTDFQELFTDPPRSRRRKARSVDLIINGEESRSTQWTYVPAMKIYMPQKKHIINKLYNAVIRGSSVKAGTDYDDPVPLLLPKPNAAFADFGAECGLGRKAKK